MRLMNETIQRQLQVFDDENNIMLSPVTGIWPPTTLDAVFDQEHPTQRTLREIIADLRQEIITGGIGNIIFPVTSVNGQSVATGNSDVIIRAATIGLGFVNNTADMDKPLSTPQRTAVEQMLQHFDWAGGNVTLGKLYEHLEDKDNPHLVTIDQLGNPEYFDNIVNNAINIHSINTSNLVHPDIRREIGDIRNRVDQNEDRLERRIRQALDELNGHFDDQDAHFSLFEMKEDVANKTTYFNQEIDNNHLKYPTTRAVLDNLANRLLEFKDEFKEDLVTNTQWLADIRVVGDVSGLPPANTLNHRRVFLIRNCQIDQLTNRMGIAVCRYNDNDEVYYWDISDTGAISRLFADHFIETPEGFRLNLTAIIDAVAMGGDPSDVGSAFDNFFTREESLRKFIQNVTILPGTMDGHLRYFTGENQATPMNILAEDTSPSATNNTFTLTHTLQSNIEQGSMGIRIQSRQSGANITQMFNFAITGIIVTNTTGGELFNLVSYLQNNLNINSFEEETVPGSGIFVSNFPMLGRAGVAIGINRPGGLPYLTITNRHAEWQGLDLLYDFFKFDAGFTITVTGRLLSPAGSNSMVLNSNTRYWREVRVPGLQNLAFKQFVTENEIIDNAVQNQHILNRAVTARTIGDKEVQARGPHHPHIMCEYGRIIGNILNEDEDEAHEVSLVQLADYLRPLIGGWPDPGVPGGNPWLTWVRDMILSPHHYVPGIEYDLRDNSFAMRFTGHISCLPNMNHEQIISEEINFPTRRLLDAGGVWQFSSNVNGGEWGLLGGTNITGHTFGSIIMDNNALRFVSISSGDRVNSPYDFWVRYYKTDSGDVHPPPPPPPPPPPSPELTLSTNSVTITNTALTAVVDVTGNVTGPIHVDRLNLPAEIEIFVSGNRITLIGNRPHIQHPNINQSTMIVVSRGAVNRALTVHMNLTATLDPLAFNVMPHIAAIRDHQPVGTFVITGYNTGPVTIDRSAIPASINVEVEVPTLGPDTPADLLNANGVVIITGNRPTSGQPSIQGIFPLRITRDGMTRVVAVDINITAIPLITLLDQHLVNISNANLTSTINVGGTTTGTITANSDYTLPNNITMTIDQINNRINIVANRPQHNESAMDDEFVVTVNRQGRSATFRVNVNLTPWPTPGVINNMTISTSTTSQNHGPYQVTLTGTNLTPMMCRIGAFLSDEQDDRFTITPTGTATQVTGTITLPENTILPAENRVYTIRASANGGLSFPATPSRVVTTTPVTTS